MAVPYAASKEFRSMIYDLLEEDIPNMDQECLMTCFYLLKPSAGTAKIQMQEAIVERMQN